MKRAISFGAYTFPDTIPDSGEILRSGFANVVPRTVRLPGLSGGFDQYGDDPAASEIGNVRVRWMLIATSAADMQAKRDAVMAMAGYGRATLTVEGFDGVQRRCLARVNNISIGTEHDIVARQLCEITADFQVSSPRWMSTNADSPRVISASGTATDVTITNAGNADAIPVITIDPTTAIGSGGMKVQRRVSGVAVDEIAYGASLLSTDLLVVHCQNLTVRKNNADAYGTVFTTIHPAWLRLKPGTNSIRVVLASGETASISVTWDDTWY